MMRNLELQLGGKMPITYFKLIFRYGAAIHPMILMFIPF